MEGVSVGRMPIEIFIGAFIFYVLTHIGIGYWFKQIKKQFDENPKSLDIQKQLKFIAILFKWYPFIFVILILVFIA